jgi:hypothetical protein
MKHSASLVAVCLAVALLTGPAVAQESDGPISWLAFQQAKSGKTEQLMALTLGHDGPMFDKLLADGKIMSWGIAIPINHNLGDTWNWVQWVTVENWAGIGDLQGGFMGLFRSRGKGEQDALTASYEAAVEPRSHFDWIVRHVAFNAPEDRAAKARYFGISYWKSRPGTEMEVVAFYREKVEPIYAELLEQGVVHSYGMYVPELHTDPNVTHVGWYTLSDLGGMDAVNAAFDGAFTPEDTEKVMGMMDWEHHSDQVLMILHMGGQKKGE